MAISHNTSTNPEQTPNLSTGYSLDTDYLVRDNEFMLRGITKRQKELLQIIYNSIKNEGYPPSFDELRGLLKVKSNQSVIDLLTSLEKKKFINREEGLARGILIKPLGYEKLNQEPLVRIAGATAAGPAIEMIEQNEWVAMPSGYRVYEDVFIVEIYGNSMNEVGIYDRDKVLIKKEKEYKSGDIVLARIGDEVTLKTFIHKDGRIYLKPENPACRIIPITHNTYFLGKYIKNLGKGI